MTRKSQIKMTRGWEVQWCVSCQLEEDGRGCLPDTAQYRIKDFASREEAEPFARSLIRDGRDFFGAVLVRQFEWTEDEYIPGSWDKEYLHEMEVSEP